MSPYVRPVESQRGMALVMVLWLIVLLSVIAGGHVQNTRGETRLAALHVEQARARAAINAAASFAIMQLLENGASDSYRIDGTVSNWEYDNLPVRVAVRHATGMIDINHADADLLQAILTEIGTENSRSNTIIGALLDWRDSDNNVRINGAEDDDYRMLGLGWTARDRPFISIEEVRYLRGMSAVLFDDIAPFLTVYSGLPGVDVGFAAPLLVRAITGRDPGSIRNEQISSRSAGTYHVYVDVPGNNGSIASAEFAVKIGGRMENPFSILNWRDSMRKPFPDDRARSVD